MHLLAVVCYTSSTMSEYVESFEDVLSELLSTTISEAVEEGVIVSKFVLVAEVYNSSESYPSLVTVPSSNLTPWDISGMLGLVKKQAESDYVNSTTLFIADDDEDED